MVDIARFSPRDGAGLEKIRGLEANTIKNQGRAILEVVQHARDSDKETWPTMKQGHRLTPSQDAIVDILMAVIRLRGAEQDVSPTLLSNRKELEKLVLGETDSGVLHGWRGELVGHELLAVLSGKKVLQVVNGKLASRDE
jgi:ribonuclease D